MYLLSQVIPNMKVRFFPQYKTFFLMSLSSLFLLTSYGVNATPHVDMGDYMAWKYGRKRVFEEIQHCHEVVRENQAISAELVKAMEEEQKNLEAIGKKLDLFEGTLRRELGPQVGPSTSQKKETPQKMPEQAGLSSTASLQLLHLFDEQVKKPFGTLRGASVSGPTNFQMLLKAAQNVSKAVGDLTKEAQSATTDQTTLSSLKTFQDSFALIQSVRGPSQKASPATSTSTAKETPKKEEDIIETLQSLKDDMQILQAQAEKIPEDEVRGTLRVVSGELNRLKKTFKKRGQLADAFNPPAIVPEVTHAPSINVKTLLEHELSSMIKEAKLNKKRSYTTKQIVSKMNRSQKDDLLALIIANQGINLNELSNLK
ncbi:MAG: hypothetical protein IBJ00_00615 [Alphaproteobacteria bacterium]|nr:hypothetical protein [Alphaproteobacteria bacterium]